MTAKIAEILSSSWRPWRAWRFVSLWIDVIGASAVAYPMLRDTEAAGRNVDAGCFTTTTA
ncbi:hypothetical protein [Sorangium atrum]|uniref:Uncharacterized protein n=1 Tax=Sorangium atrum TaxID=2995308 RepID=A0ABT5CCE8_9BACT|nr:hypothetical protein [Sorangium aterium]MDC0683459.1 hypothetical protein [Sorangium aterium]